MQISELGVGGEGEPVEVSLVSLGKDRGSDPSSRSVQGLRIESAGKHVPGAGTKQDRDII